MDSARTHLELSRVLDALPTGIIIVDCDWVVLQVNAAAERTLGIARDAMKERVLWEVSTHFPKDLQLPPETGNATQRCESDVLDKRIRFEVVTIDAGRRVIHLSEVETEMGSGPTSDQIRRALEYEIERRQAADRALETNQEFLQAVLDNIEAGIVACDETGTLRLFNNATRKFHGLSEAPLQAEEWPAQYDLYYPDGKTLLRKEDVPLYRAFLGEAVRNTELVIAPKDGQRRFLLASGRALFARDGRKLGAVVAMHDITHRKLSSKRLREALRQFRTLFNDAPIAYHETDRHGIIRRVNRAECRLLRRSREELIGKPAWEFVSEHEREKTRVAVLEKTSGQRPIESVEIEYITAAGSPVVVETHENLIYSGAGEIAGIRTAMLDITDRKQREQQAQALMQERFARQQAEATSAEVRSVLERISDAYMAFDTGWRYIYVNRKAAELALKPASELLGRCVWDEFPEAVHTPFFTELQRSMREQIPRDFINHYVPLGKWFENTVYPSPSGVSVFYRDITERVHTQQALEARTEELSRMNEELETFAYVVSHDLQEPLRMIGGYASLLCSRYSAGLDADANDFLSFITGGVDRMQRLIRDLLAFCQLTERSAAPLTDVSVSRIVDFACNNLDLVIEDTRAAIECKGLPTVKFNETQLLQLMQNLIGNALKYRSDATPRIRVCAEREKAGWKISVSDNGTGFDMSHADRIFKPFKRLHTTETAGTGIGLAICKKIVESRGGRIWVESTPGIGSEFYFTVPDALPSSNNSFSERRRAGV